MSCICRVPTFTQQPLWGIGATLKFRKLLTFCTCRQSFLPWFVALLLTLFSFSWNRRYCWLCACLFVGLFLVLICCFFAELLPSGGPLSSKTPLFSVFCPFAPPTCLVCGLAFISLAKTSYRLLPCCFSHFCSTYDCSPISSKKSERLAFLPLFYTKTKNPFFSCLFFVKYWIFSRKKGGGGGSGGQMVEYGRIGRFWRERRDFWAVMPNYLFLLSISLCWRSAKSLSPGREPWYELFLP